MSGDQPLDCHFEHILTLRYIPGRGTIEIVQSELASNAPVDMRHAWLDKLHEVLDPGDEWPG